MREKSDVGAPSAHTLLMNHKILIIDDDQALCRLLKKCLETEGIAADLAHNGKDGLQQALRESYQLIVLDIMLPEMDGFQVLEELRRESAVPVLMLTAKNNKQDKVAGLLGGADDYLTKPFDVEEFTARVFSLIRRYTTLNATANESESPLTFPGITIDIDARTVTVGGESITLLAKEFDILCCLARNAGKILTKKQIYETVWQEAYAYDDSNIMAHISRLRKKIEPDPNHPTLIQTVKGIGYRFQGGEAG